MSEFADPDIEEEPSQSNSNNQASIETSVEAPSSPKSKNKKKKNKNKNKKNKQNTENNESNGNAQTENSKNQKPEAATVAKNLKTVEQKMEATKSQLEEHVEVLSAQEKKKKDIEEQIKLLKAQLDNKFVDILQNAEINPTDVADQPYADEGLSFNRTVTVKAPMNIAFVKYWGKRDVNLNTPLNSSLSATLDPNIMFSETTVETSRYLMRDEISINGADFEQIPANGRTAAVLKELRYLGRRVHGKVKMTTKDQEDGRKKQSINMNEDALPASFFSQKLRIKSNNNFPTAAGLASSASGYAALVYAIAHLYTLNPQIANTETSKKLSTIARQGSGSACRSMFGGFVEWQKGEEKDGRDSIAVQVQDMNHWPELRFLICVCEQDKKKVSSTTGMIRSQRTSTLLEHRTNKVAEQILGLCKNAIKKRDFAMLSELIMRDSNQFHAICQDTFPPLDYLNATSKKLMDMVHRYNGQTAKKCLAYTFDAGPNAVLITTQEHIYTVAQLVKKHFKSPEKDHEEFFNSIQGTLPVYVPKEEPIELENFEGIEGGVDYCILTSIGMGPRVSHDAFEVVDVKKKSTE